MGQRDIYDFVHKHTTFTTQTGLYTVFDRYVCTLTIYVCAIVTLKFKLSESCD